MFTNLTPQGGFNADQANQTLRDGGHYIPGPCSRQPTIAPVAHPTAQTHVCDGDIDM